MSWANQYKNNKPILNSIVSGIAFLQYEVNKRDVFFMGVAVFFWTIINGFSLNIEYRKATLANKNLEQ